MDLFSNTPKNILPFDGEVYYFKNVISLIKAEQYDNTLHKTISWKKEEAYLFGKHILMNREVALYGDTSILYKYSNTLKEAQPWTSELIDLKKIVETKAETTFNSCLLNLYPTGKDGMGWHADDESVLGKNPIIASLNFGADRKFSFKHKNTKQTVSIYLEKGSLLLMKGKTQHYWLHQLPKTSSILRPRINLTFRNILI